MKIALVGATGHIGRHIARVALARGHEVTAIVRRENDQPAELAGARLVLARLDDPQALAAAVRGHDVLASAFGPAQGQEAGLASISSALLSAARIAGVPRLVVVGGAGSLEVAPGAQLIDTAGFPDAYKPIASAHRQALQVYQAANASDDVAWTFFAPAAEIGPGEHRGQHRTQARQFLADGQGHSRISYADFADAFVDEIEQARYPRQVVTAAY